MEDLRRHLDDSLREQRLFEAVDLLTELNRRHRDERVECHLVELRHRAFAAAEQGVTSVDWSSASHGPLRVGIRIDGIPTIEANELDSTTLGDGIRSGGCLRVPSLLPPGAVDALRGGILRSWASRDRFNASPDATADEWYAPFQPQKPYRIGPKRVWAQDTGGLPAFDAPAVLFDLIEMLTDVGVLDAIEGYLGERPAVSFDKSTLRNVSSDSNTDWHQDGAFLGEQIHSVNVWIALSECGVDAPGLDIVPARFEEIITTGSAGAFFDWSIGDDVVRARAGEAGVVRPVFQPGDVLLFDQFLVHRTAVAPTMSKSRLAVELWCFGPSAYPDGHIPMIL